MAKTCHRASFEMEKAPQHSLEHPMSPLLESKPSTPSQGMLSQKEARTLEESSSSLLRHLSPHFAILVIPTYSIILGASIAMLDGKAQSRAGDVTMQAARVAATLWPITFAAVIGPMVKAIAIYHAQKGSRLGILEVLCASQTLMSTIRGCIALREMNLWVLTILTIWLLSPVGSQGVLRALELRQEWPSSSLSVRSFPINKVADISADINNFGVNPSYSQWSVIAGSALSSWDLGLMHSNGSSPIFNHTVEMAGGERLAVDSTRDDLWRNVRIPFLHLLPKYDRDRPFEWVNVFSDSIPPYESLIGIPIRGIPSKVAGNASLIIQSSYQNLDYEGSLSKSKWSSVLNGTITPTANDNTTESDTFLDIVDDTQRLRQIRTKPLTGPFFSKQVLALGSWSDAVGHLRLCNITTSYVDSEIKCVRPADNAQLSCAAIAIRHTENPPLSENVTAFDAYNRASMLRFIPSIMANPPNSFGIFERFLNNPPTAFVQSTNVDKSFMTLPREVLEARLGMLINTFLRASYDTASLIGMRNEGYPLWTNYTGTWTQSSGYFYDLQKPWFTLYIFSTFVLSVCALANILFRSMTVVPDFLGSVSALTRDSPFVDAPSSGSTMDGIERARLLKDKLVRIQDVKPNEKVGRLAFSDAKSSRGFRMGRIYE